MKVTFERMSGHKKVILRIYLKIIEIVGLQYVFSKKDNIFRWKSWSDSFSYRNWTL